MNSVSVIIPTFNRKEFLPATLASVLNQTMPPDEIILVDDHSTDGTEELVQRYFPTQVRFVKSKGKGPGAARNTGLSLAQGDFIKFFDSDDLMTVNTLEVQHRLLTSSPKQFVYSAYIQAREIEHRAWQSDNVVMHYDPFDPDQPLWYLMLKYGLFVTIPGMLCKKQFLGEVGRWREDVIAYEDWDYLFRMSLLEPFPIHTNECAFIYRMHGTQSTHSNMTDEQRDLDKIKVLEDLEKKVLNDNRLGFFERALLKNKFFELHKQSKAKRVRDQLSRHSSLSQYLLWQYLRLIRKRGRVKTGTAWQKCHGPRVSSRLANQYLAMVEMHSRHSLFVGNLK
jgi:glycosyltransferase involved in cell wall biosynthesis